MEEILDILEKNSKATESQIAIMIGKDVDFVRSKIKEYQEKKIILGYNTLIDWEKTNKESVTALIEIKVTPQRGQGFDNVAERIYKFKEVTSCYLMSGGFDISVIIEGKSMKEVALFVAEKLSPLEGVLSTSTHFVLKKYKDSGIVFDEAKQDDREAIIL